MKHIFVVHSNLTYLSALGVIDNDNLNLDDCRIISYNYTRSEPVPVIYVPTFEGLIDSHFNLRRYFCPLSVIDSHIERIVDGQPYTLYISICNKLARAAMTHPLCCDYHFFEEGLSAYSTHFGVNILTAHNTSTPWRGKGIWARIKDIKFPLRGYNSRLNAIPIFYNSHSSYSRRYYGFSPHSHILVSEHCRVVMDMYAIANRFNFATLYNFNNSHIWISNLVGFDISESYFSALATFINSELLAKGIDHLYLKFHYRQPAELRLRELNVFKEHNINIDIIDDSVVLEIELLKTRSAVLYGTSSSLLFYGSLLGNKSYSIDSFIGARNVGEHIPVFWQYINKL